MHLNFEALSWSLVALSPTDTGRRSLGGWQSGRGKSNLGKKCGLKITAIPRGKLSYIPVLVLSIAPRVLSESDHRSRHSISWVCDRLLVWAEGGLLYGGAQWRALVSGPRNKAALERAWWQICVEKIWKIKRKGKARINNSINRQTKSLGEELVKRCPGHICLSRAALNQLQQHFLATPSYRQGRVWHRLEPGHRKAKGTACCASTLPPEQTKYMTSLRSQLAR